MKTINKIAVFFALIVLVVACNDDDGNPVLTGADLKVFFVGVGDNVKNTALAGYNVLVGESLTVDLQVSPKNGTTGVWLLESDETVLSNTLSYTYAPEQEESIRVLFIASLGTEFADTTLFNFNGVLDGETSKINEWQNFLIEQGGQTGTFTAEFDATPNKANIDAVVGFGNGIASTYSNLSCLIRFNPSGNIDAYTGAPYGALNDVAYQPGLTYHFKVDVDATTMTYDVKVTPPGGSETEIGTGLAFRNQSTNLKYWSMVAGDYLLDDPGTHRVFNMVITTHTLNEAPVFAAVDDQQLDEGGTLVVDIVANDPFDGFVTLSGQNLPRFATFVDLGGGKGTLTIEPYSDCGGCDLGDYAITIVATNKATSSEQIVNVKVKDPFASFTIDADEADGQLASSGLFDATFAQSTVGKMGQDGTAWAGLNVVGIIPFELPDIPEGKEFESAQLEATFSHSATWGQGWFDASYDLYAISYRSAATIQASDYFVGAYDTDANSTAIMEGFFTDVDALGTYTSSVQAGIDLADFVNQQYANGAVAGDYVFLRLNQHRDGAEWLIGQFATVETPNAGTAPKLIVNYRDKD